MNTPIYDELILERFDIYGTDLHTLRHWINGWGPLRYNPQTGYYHG